ncbi:MAG: tRNA pseudouridine(38-40) synthase TruA [Bacteroidota bacterium]
MPRYVLDISYLGTEYAGWQIQPNAPTVQEKLEKALSTFLRNPIRVVGAGRTDTGVHARQLIVHFDWEQPLEARFSNAINGLLPHDIALNGVFLANSPKFHSRFDATSRRYEYNIVLRKTPELHTTALWVRHSLDVEAMNQAAGILMEYHDFASFAKIHHDAKTTFCDVTEAVWQEVSPYHLQFFVRANRFLRGMVRALIGTQLLIGKGQMSVDAFRQVVEATDRAAAGPNVSPKGLSLIEVTYPDDSWSELEYKS